MHDLMDGSVVRRLLATAKNRGGGGGAEGGGGADSLAATWELMAEVQMLPMPTAPMSQIEVGRRGRPREEVVLHLATGRAVTTTTTTTTTITTITTTDTRSKTPAPTLSSHGPSPATFSRVTMAKRATMACGGTSSSGCLSASALPTRAARAPTQRS